MMSIVAPVLSYPRQCPVTAHRRTWHRPEHGGHTGLSYTAATKPPTPPPASHHRSVRTCRTCTIFYCHCQRLNTKSDHCSEKRALLFSNGWHKGFQFTCKEHTHESCKLTIIHFNLCSSWVFLLLLYVYIVYRKSSFYPKVETLTLASMQTLFIIFWSSLSSQQHFE